MCPSQSHPNGLWSGISEPPVTGKEAVVVGSRGQGKLGCLVYGALLDQAEAHKLWGVYGCLGSCAAGRRRLVYDDMDTNYDDLCTFETFVGFHIAVLSLYALFQLRFQHWHAAFSVHGRGQVLQCSHCACSARHCRLARNTGILSACGPTAITYDESHKPS